MKWNVVDYVLDREIRRYFIKLSFVANMGKRDFSWKKEDFFFTIKWISFIQLWK